MRTNKISLLLYLMLIITTTVKAQDCSNLGDFSNICVGEDTYYKAGSGFSGSAQDIQPGNNYECLKTTPNSRWFYLKAASTGHFKIKQTNSSNVDVDGAVWGPFDSLDDVVNKCGSYGVPLFCDYERVAGFEFDLNLQKGKIYVFLVNNFSRIPTNITLKDMGSTASTECKPDLLVQKTANKVNVAKGDVVEWTIKVTNKGTKKATKVFVHDKLPDGLQYQGATQPTYEPSTGRWYVGDLDKNQSKMIKIRTQINTAKCEVLTNKVTKVTLAEEESNIMPDQLEASVSVANGATIPIFSSMPSSVPKGGTFTLPPISDNGIFGTWSPSVANTNNNTTYTFTPSTGSCAKVITKTVEITEDRCRVYFTQEPRGHLCNGVLTITAAAGVKGSSNTNINYQITIQNTSSASIFKRIKGSTTAGVPISKSVKLPGPISDYSYGINFTQPPGFGCSITKQLEYQSIITKDITPDFDPIPPVFQGSEFTLPSFSTNGIKGTWSPAPSSAVVGEHTYTFRPDNPNCIRPASIKVKVIKPIIPDASCSVIIDQNPADSKYCDGKMSFSSKARISNSSSQIKYQWQYRASATAPWTNVGSEATLHSSGIATLELTTVSNTWEGRQYRVVYKAVDDTGCTATSDPAKILTEESIAPTFDPIADVYQYGSLTLPTTSKNGIKGAWSPSVNTSTIGTSTYTFNPNAGQCATSVTIDVKVVPKPASCIDVVSPKNFCVPSSGWGHNIFKAKATTISGKKYRFQWYKDENDGSGFVKVRSYDRTYPDHGVKASGTEIALRGYVEAGMKYKVKFEDLDHSCVTWSDEAVQSTGGAPTFDPITFGSCSSGNPLPATSKEGYTGSWSPTFDPTTSKTYTFTPDAGQCASGTGTVSVTISTASSLTTTAVTWNGSKSTVWNDCANWTPSVIPTSSIDVIIPLPSSGRKPSINSEAHAKNITIQSGESLTNANKLIVEQNIKLEGTSKLINTANKNSMITIKGNLNLLRNTTLDNSASISISGHISNAGNIKTSDEDALFTLDGNIDNSGSIELHHGAFVLQGSAPSSIEGNTPSFQTLSINKSSAVNIMTTSLEVKKQLGLVQGFLVPDSGKMIVLTKNATANAGNNNSYVKGKVRKYVNSSSPSDFTFPIGKAIIGNISIESLESTQSGDYFTAEYFKGAYPDLTVADDNPPYAKLDHVSRLEYWILDRNTGGKTKAKVKLHWTSYSESDIKNPTGSSDLMVAHYGTNWKSRGGYVDETNKTVISDQVQDDFSPWTFGTVTGFNPLPVKILSLRASKKEKYNLINWTTENDPVTKRFEVQRSTDNVRFESFASVPAKILDQSVLSYDAIDSKPFAGTIYYRLKLFDADGASSYSKVVALHQDEATTDLAIFPNPFEGKITIRFDLLLDVAYKITVKDILGRTVYEANYKSKGKNELSFDLSFLPKATYILELTHPNGVIRKKIVRK